MNKITKNLKCISIRNGIEIWIDDERVKQLQERLINLKSHVFLNYDGRTINTADITGVFNAVDMEDMKHRKNGQWQCEFGNWHDKFKECDCKLKIKHDKEEERKILSKDCKICKDGYVLMVSRTGTEELLPCECIYSTISEKKQDEIKKYIEKNDFRIK